MLETKQKGWNHRNLLPNDKAVEVRVMGVSRDTVNEGGASVLVE